MAAHRGASGAEIQADQDSSPGHVDPALVGSTQGQEPTEEEAMTEITATVVPTPSTARNRRIGRATAVAGPPP